MYIAHGPISYLANEAIQNKKIKQLKMNEQILVALCSLFFGILPDFDILILSMFNAPRFIHHDIVTHSPILYIGIWIFLKGLVHFSDKIFNKKTGKVLDKRLLNILVNTFLIGTLAHLLADLLVNSLMLLYPLTDFRFFTLKFLFEPNIFAGLPFSVMFAIEILFISIFVYVIYKKFFKRNKVVTILSQLFMLLATIYLPFTMYISLNTYNSTYMYDVKGDINFDIDYDGMSDKFDIDVGNTGESNIYKADDTAVLNSALNIVNSRKWTNNHENKLVASIKERYGGFDSYRLVAQAYYDIRLPIGPALRDYSIKKYGFESYLYDDYDSPTLLFEYLLENNYLVELNLDATVNLPSGRIFFVLSNEEQEESGDFKIENLGITLEGNYLAIVLDSDEHLKMHSYDSVRETYGDSIRAIFIQK